MHVENKVPSNINSLKTRLPLKINNISYTYYSIDALKKTPLGDFSRLPCSLKILLENLLRHEDGQTVSIKDIKAFKTWLGKKTSTHEINFSPARVLMQDFTGVPAIVDLAAMRDAVKTAGGNTKNINPLSAVDLVVDHSVMVDYFGNKDAFKANVALEYQRNKERYEFLRWGQTAFNNFRVVPPGTGICHQVNIEYLAKVVWLEKTKQNNKIQNLIYPDSVVGTDSHTTMVNGLSVLGWGVGGIEAEAAMLGQPISMTIPEVVGVKLIGTLKEGITATDLVLTITETLRKKGVVNKFVEFYGSGLSMLTLEDRSTIANMAPEYGATCGFFPVDQETIKYLKATGRPTSLITLVETYAKKQGLWYSTKSADPIFTDIVEIDLSQIKTSLAGPKRPQDRVSLDAVPQNFTGLLKSSSQISKDLLYQDPRPLQDGDVVIAAITSCTNTSNPNVMVGAGLLAKNANKLGLKTKSWVKTSLAPGSQVVSDYLNKSGLQKELDKLGFNLVGYGCTTCIGNSGPLSSDITDSIVKNNLIVCSVLSGNRNFEGRINPLSQANYLTSPILVVAYALAGSMRIDLTLDPLGYDKKGKAIYLKDIWPSQQEIQQTIRKIITPKMYRDRYKNVFAGDDFWKKIKTPKTQTFDWDKNSTYVRLPPYFTDQHSPTNKTLDIKNARLLALLGNSVTTDHISPAGSIKKDSPAGLYLLNKKVKIEDFNSYGSRRGNHEVMMRGTFANIRLRNEIVPGIEGGMTRHIPSNKVMSIYDASMLYQSTQTPLIIIAGKEYGTGSSRDWAAKGTVLLGVKAVIAESFERIHRSNLIGMGVLPLQFPDNITKDSLHLDGSEFFDIIGVNNTRKPRAELNLIIKRTNGQIEKIKLICKINTLEEVEYYQHNGILSYVLKKFIKKAA
ncbi:MAG: aconitate hydratase AcnA [Alphaproteobacteria bacterium]|nr:aconitate hydratase AcnA [Alphaproteobacteria bacterium]